jgi:hypothetical protein
MSNFVAASLNRPFPVWWLVRVLPWRPSDMRFAQIALVAAVVIVGFLGYTIPGHRLLNEMRSDFPTRASTVAASPVRGSKAVGGLFH